MKTLATKLFLFNVLFLSACGANVAIKTETITDYKWQFADSYIWEKGGGISTIDPNSKDAVKIDNLISQLIDKQLQAKGLRHVESVEKADLLVTYLVTIKPKIDVHDQIKWFNEDVIRRTLDPAGTIGPAGYVWTTPIPKAIEYTEGTLLVIIADAKTEKTLWQATAIGVVDRGASEDKRKRRIDRITKRIFAKFPTDK